MNVLHYARRNFLQLENSKKIRRVFKHQIRTNAKKIYEKGETGYFKRKGSSGQKGPDEVLRSDG